jgi:2-dehydropantoate 2-reductase
VSDESILIVGSGAVATLFAAKIGAAGYDVRMLGSWPDAIRAIRSNGIHLKLGDGTQLNVNVTIRTDPAELGPVQRAIVLVKSWQTRQYAEKIRQCLTGDGIALTLQNGLGNLEILAEVLGKQRSAAGIIMLGATMLQPGIVQTSGEALVQLDQQAGLTLFGNLLSNSGFRVDSYPDLTGLQWGKLIINAAINPLSAILGVPNGVLLKSKHSRALLKQLAQEGQQVAAAHGISLPYPDAFMAVEGVIERTKNNTSSMLQDRLRGAPTEIDAINAEIVHYARLAGLSAPVNENMVSLVKALVEVFA